MPKRDRATGRWYSENPNTVCACGSPTTAGRRQCARCYLSEYSRSTVGRDGQRRYREANKPLLRLRKAKYGKQYYGEAQKQYALRLKMEMISAYGGKCACCGEVDHEFLTLDHPKRDGRQHRKQVGAAAGTWRDLKKRGWPKDDYRLFCWNCNMATRHGNTCPHQLRHLALVLEG